MQSWLGAAGGLGPAGLRFAKSQLRLPKPQLARTSWQTGVGSEEPVDGDARCEGEPVLKWDSQSSSLQRLRDLRPFAGNGNFQD